MPHRRANLLLIIAMLLAWAATPHPAPAASERLPTQLSDAPFGLNTHLATRYTELEHMDVPASLVAQTGASWVREDIQWWRVQPTPDTWDWSYTDAAFRALLQHNINIVAVLGHPPGWATPDATDSATDVSFAAPDIERFAVFANAAAQRYGHYIHHWEIWNEPDNPLFWKPAPDANAYAALLKRASIAIHGVAPDAQVLLGGINPFNITFLRQVAQAGAWGSFDILAIHPYIDPATPEEGNLLAAADSVRALAAQLGPMPIWVTEVGWASGPGDHDAVGMLDEQGQAQMLVRGLLLLWRAGIERIFWYTLKDDQNNPYGLIALGNGRADYSRLKPAYYAFQTLVRQTNGAEFMALNDLFTRTTVLDFETFGAWRRGDQPNGMLTPTSTQTHSGRTGARLDYTFPSRGNDYVVFLRDRPAFIPGAPYALGVWVYGDGSGHQLKLWLQDATGELLQFTLGTVGPPGWRLLEAPISGIVPVWNRIRNAGDGKVQFPARIAALVLDDGDDQFIGSGSIVLDDIIALSGPEAYDFQLRQNNTTIDILWAPQGQRAAIRTQAEQAAVIAIDGSLSTASATDGKLTFSLGPSPIYVRHSY